MEKMVLSFSSDSSEMVCDRRKDGWMLIRDVLVEGETTLELTEFLRDEEDFVTGEDMLFRAVEMGSLAGQRHAERMLALAGEVPESWHEFILIFPGTIWQDPRGDRRVLCLGWDAGRWIRGWRWLGRDWYSGGRLVRLSHS